MFFSSQGDRQQIDCDGVLAACSPSRVSAKENYSCYELHVDGGSRLAALLKVVGGLQVCFSRMRPQVGIAG